MITKVKTHWNLKTLDIHAILLNLQLGKIVNGDAFVKATKTSQSEESQREGQKGCDQQIRNQTGKHDQHHVISPSTISLPSPWPALPRKKLQ